MAASAKDLSVTMTSPLDSKIFGDLSVSYSKAMALLDDKQKSKYSLFLIERARLTEIHLEKINELIERQLAKITLEPFSPNESLLSFLLFEELILLLNIPTEKRPSFFEKIQARIPEIKDEMKPDTIFNWRYCLALEILQHDITEYQKSRKKGLKMLSTTKTNQMKDVAIREAFIAIICTLKHNNIERLNHFFREEYIKLWRINNYKDPKFSGLLTLTYRIRAKLLEGFVNRDIDHCVTILRPELTVYHRVTENASLVSNKIIKFRNNELNEFATKIINHVAISPTPFTDSQKNILKAFLEILMDFQVCYNQVFGRRNDPLCTPIAFLTQAINLSQNSANRLYIINLTDFLAEKTRDIDDQAEDQQWMRAWIDHEKRKIDTHLDNIKKIAIAELKQVEVKTIADKKMEQQKLKKYVGPQCDDYLRSELEEEDEEKINPLEAPKRPSF